MKETQNFCCGTQLSRKLFFMLKYIYYSLIIEESRYFQIGVKRTEQTDHGPSDGLLSSDGSVHCTLNAFQTAQ